MKNIGTKISQWFKKLEEGWRLLPVKRQRFYTLLLFSVYTLVSLIIIAKICYDVGRNGSTLKIEHIDNPLVKPQKSGRISMNSALKIF